MPLPHHLIDQIAQQHNLEEPEAMARAIHAAASVVSSLPEPAAQAQALTYLATRVNRDETLIYRYIEDGAQPAARWGSRKHGRSIA